jgi:hypothetical protein
MGNESNKAEQTTVAPMQETVVEVRSVEQSWLFQNWQLVTPWMAGRMDTTAALVQSDPEYSYLSLQAETMRRNILQLRVGKAQKPEAFSDQTLRSIVSNYTSTHPTERKEFEASNQDKNYLSTYIWRIIKAEVSLYEVNFGHYEVGLLMAGILTKGMTEYLSPNDLMRWALWYGFNDKFVAKLQHDTGTGPNQTQAWADIWRSSAIALILDQQKIVFEELLYHKIAKNQETIASLHRFISGVGPGAGTGIGAEIRTGISGSEANTPIRRTPNLTSFNEPLSSLSLNPGFNSGLRSGYSYGRN